MVVVVANDEQANGGEEGGACAPPGQNFCSNGSMRNPSLQKGQVAGKSLRRLLPVSTEASKESEEEPSFRDESEIESAAFLKCAHHHRLSVGRGDPRITTPYHLQGDTSFDAPKAKAKRAAIRQNDRVQEALEVWWETAVRCAEQDVLSADGGLLEQPYFAINKRIYKASGLVADGPPCPKPAPLTLSPRGTSRADALAALAQAMIEEWDVAAAETSAREDWTNVARPGGNEWPGRPRRPRDCNTTWRPGARAASTVQPHCLWRFRHAGRQRGGSAPARRL